MPGDTANSLSLCQSAFKIQHMPVISLGEERERADMKQR